MKDIIRSTHQRDADRKAREALMQKVDKPSLSSDDYFYLHRMKQMGSERGIMPEGMQTLMEYLAYVYEVENFDERKSRWNMVAAVAERLNQDNNLSLFDEDAVKFINLVRYLVPSPQSIRLFEVSYTSFRDHFNKTEYFGARSGRTSGKTMNLSSPPRTSPPRSSQREDVTPAYLTPIYMDDDKPTHTHHTPSHSPSHDSPSSHDSGSSSSDGGGGGSSD